jgi:hypothetical protein
MRSDDIKAYLSEALCRQRWQGFMYRTQAVSPIGGFERYGDLLIFEPAVKSDGGA